MEATRSHFDGDALKISRYFNRFQELIKTEPAVMELKGDQILIERLPKPELKTKSGLILASVSGYKQTMEDSITEFAIVLMTGPGLLDENGNSIPCDCKPGDVVMVPGSTIWYSAFGHMADYDPNSIGRTRDTAIPIWFGNYVRAFEILSGGADGGT